MRSVKSFIATALVVLILVKSVNPAPSVPVSTTCPESCQCSSALLACNGTGTKYKTVPSVKIKDHFFSVLDFRNNNISSIDTEDWNLYSGGTSLNLANNSLENLPWNAFVGLPNLRHLDVSMNKIEEINSSVFETTPSLHEMNFSYNPLSKVKFTVFKKLPALETLDLSGTRFLDMNVQSFVATQPYMTDLFLPVHIVCCTCNSTNSTTTIHKAVKRMCYQVCRDTHISCGALDNTTLYGYDGTPLDKYTNLSSSFSRTKKLNWADELDMQKLNLLRALIAKQIQERENISEEQASGNMLSTASRENKVQKQPQEAPTTQAPTTQAPTTQAPTTQMTAESKKIMVPALKQEIDLGKTPDVGSKIAVVLVNGSEGENFKSNKIFPGASHKKRLQRRVNDEIKTAFVFINNTKGELIHLAEMVPDENSQQGSNASKDMTIQPNVSILLLDTRQNTSQLVYSRDRSGSPDWSNLKRNMSSVKVDTDHDLPLIEGAADSLPPVKNRAMDLLAPVIEKPPRTKLQFNPYESDLPKVDINTIAVYPSDTNDGINTMDNNITPNKSYSLPLTNYTSSSTEQTSTAAINATTAEHSLTTVEELSVFISRVNTSHMNESFVADLLKLIDEIQIIVLNKTVLVSILKLIEEDCLQPNQAVACEEGVSNINMLIEQVIDNKDMEAEMNPSQYKHTRLLEAKKISDRSNLILAIAVTTAVVIIIALVCIMEILSQRSQSQDGKTPGGGRPLQRISQIFARNSSVDQASIFLSDSPLATKPLWIQDLYKPLDSVRRKNMGQAMYDRFSSDEEEIFNKGYVG
ncbi:leucine-rich repeat-containing protein 37A3-like [Acipenser oxyrinchus oxyrinchus]|uniref:Leucine-rich repeat-containing protein 37A3-like n=1 Tax=Acipenser oxyrinchus oxyrinchus TaxID=40147 RepID=A0AAD8CXW2_ACIOX|nr:leucine-rich repeat-containing protein 37A3-like [Acipenser oxyrinchus oxyrinchus]